MHVMRTSNTVPTHIFVEGYGMTDMEAYVCVYI